MHPRIRSDLQLHPESASTESPVVVKDPISRRFYRLSADQARVMSHLDGNRSPSSVAEKVSVDTGRDITEAQVKQFILILRQNCLLDHPWCWARLRALAAPKRRILGSLLSIKIRAFDPDQLLERLEQRVRFCFGVDFFLFWNLSLLAALYISFCNREALATSLSSLFRLGSLPFLFVVIFLVMTAHEFGHGLALKHFGGRTEEMGFLILYFMPGLYCNVDDAWLLPRRQRLLVSLAGGYVQILVWSWAIIAWRILSPETVLSRICSITIAFAGIQTLFNFNPLIRMDGYYLLSDFLQIPNLRERSFRYIRDLARNALGSGTIRSNSGEGPPRVRRVYACYGLAAFAFTAALGWIVFARLGSWLIQEYSAWGIAGLAVIGFAAVPPSNREGKPGAPPGEASAIRWYRRIPRWGGLLACLLLLCFFPWELKIAGDFTILSNRRIAVSPEVEGTLKAIRIDEGSRVRAGDILGEFENLDLEKNLRETQAEASTKKARLDLLRAGARPEEIERSKRLVATRQAEMDALLRLDQERRLLQETVLKKEAELWQAKQNLDRSARLFSDGLVPKADLDRDQTAFQVVQRELSEAKGQMPVLQERAERAWEVKKKEKEQAESELALLMAGTRKESIREAESELKQLEEKLSILEQQAKRMQIRSPMDGVVATPFLANRLGEKLDRGTLLCEIVSSGSVIIDMPVPEKEIADVRIGLPIDARVRGFPRNPMVAQVISIAPIATESSGERMVLVRGELPNGDGSLKAGMTGVGKILCGKRLIGELLTRRLIRWIRTDFWEYIP